MGLENNIRELVKRRIIKLSKARIETLRKTTRLLKMQDKIQLYEREMVLIECQRMVYTNLYDEGSISKEVYNDKILLLTRKCRTEFNKLIGLSSNIDINEKLLINREIEG